MRYHPLKLLHYWFSLALWKQMLIALVLGMAFGLTFQTKMIWIEPVGLMFIKAIQMLVAPVVFTAIVCAILSLKSYAKARSLVTKALLLYALGMVVAATIGIIIADFMQVGMGLPMIQKTIHGLVATGPIATQKISFGTILLGLVPTSPVSAFAQNNVLQILVFSVLFGIALKQSGSACKPLVDLFFALSQVIFRLCHLVIGFAPYGVFALIASVFGSYGLSVLMPLIKFVCTVYLSCFIFIVCYYGGMLFLRGICVHTFFSRIFAPLAMAFTTSSSMATLPITMRCAKEALHLDPSISNFLLPLGSSLNLNGLAIYLSISTIFAAHVFGISLHFHQYIVLVFSIALISAGSAAIPGSALILMGAIMQSIGIPLGALPLIAGVDRFNDMMQTMTNVIGDLVATMIVAHSMRQPRALKKTKHTVGTTRKSDKVGRDAE